MCQSLIEHGSGVNRHTNRKLSTSLSRAKFTRNSPRRQNNVNCGRPIPRKKQEDVAIPMLQVCKCGTKPALLTLLLLLTMLRISFADIVDVWFKGLVTFWWSTARSSQQFGIAASRSNTPITLSSSEVSSVDCSTCRTLRGTR
uniref:Uncharacterized protein n=1 Tax=Physcomitrium patens TaxID=3218 RepID=A9RSZ0_PHYPA|nr:hypothetical protein PHYPA_021624 [Physcomitrium patens]